MKTRFCPSPTGLLHIGNLRTALFNVLIAHSTGGKFLLRVEDTDQERSKSIYTQYLQEDLDWLDLGPDEGPEKDGGNGPYHQSQRQAIYDEYYTKLIEAKLAYPCFCTEEQLALARKLQRASGKPPRYPGTCRNLSESEIEQKLANGIKPTLRFCIPQNEIIKFEDLVRGPQHFETNDLGDFIIRRADGTAPFMYCNAIDDALMGVTLASRGEDHLTNTPRQLMILRALGLPEPTYAHTALILGMDGAPLSKRNGSCSLRDLRATGYLPSALLNYLSRLGHRYENDGFMNLMELAEQFSIEKLSKSAAKFDEQQLNHWQKEAIHHTDDETLWRWMGESVHQHVPAELKTLFIASVKANILFPSDALNWANAFFDPALTHSAENEQIIKTAGATFFQELLAGLATEGPDLKALSALLKTKLGIKGKAFFQPVRIALTGQAHGPDMQQLASILKQEGMQKRFQQALEITQAH